MIPRYLRLTGFLSYLEPVELDFTQFDLACISGANGAGKSSLLDAITWVLFGQARRRDDTLINSYSGSAEVIFDFEYENDIYRIQRSKTVGKSAMLEFFVRDEKERWRPLTEHTLRETEARIEQTLRMDYEVFTNASFFLQGKADQFAQQRPGDRKRILSSILGLEIWETYRERAGVRRKRIENELAVLDGQVNEIRLELDQEDARQARLHQLQEALAQYATLRQAKEEALGNARRLAASLDEQRRLVEMLNVQVQAARQRREQHAEHLQERKQEFEQFQQRLASAAQVESSYHDWLAVRKKLEEYDSLAVNFREFESRRSAPQLVIEGERSRLQQELNGLMERRDQLTASEAQIPALEKEIAFADAEVKNFKTQLEARDMYVLELRELQKSHTEALAEKLSLKQEMNDLKERIDRLKETTGADCPVCGKPLSAKEREDLILDLENQGKQLGDRFRSILSLVREGEEQQRVLEIKIVELQEMDDHLRKAQRVLDQLSDRLVQIKQIQDDWQSGAALRLQEVYCILTEGDFAKEARDELSKVDSALKELGYDAVLHDELRRAEQAGRASEQALRLLESARAAMEPLSREISSLEKQLHEEDVELKKQEVAQRAADEKLKVDSASGPDIRQAEMELFGLQEQENHARMQVGGALQAVEVLKTLRVRHVELTEQREIHTHQIAQLKMLERAFSKDGVPALLIEQALPEIEAQTNEILDRLSAGSMSVRFETQKEYKDKNRDDKRETLDIMISDSAGTREYELFSGGEAFRVNFAIRLALSRVLAQRAGARLQTLVIDEGFGSQDVDGRQRLIEAINLVRDDFAKILVITHLEELKDAFPARVEVEKHVNGSSVQVIV